MSLVKHYYSLVRIHTTYLHCVVNHRKLYSMEVFSRHIIPPEYFDKTFRPYVLPWKDLRMVMMWNVFRMIAFSEYYLSKLSDGQQSSLYSLGAVDLVARLWFEVLPSFQILSVGTVFVTSTILRIFLSLLVAAFGDRWRFKKTKCFLRKLSG